LEAAPMVIIQLERDGVFIFQLQGRIIAPDIQELTDTVQNTLSQINDAPKLVFDFKDVTGMDSSGLGALMKIYTDIHPRGGSIAVINVNKHVKNLIVMARLITVFRNFENEEEAVWALLNPPSESTQ
jgi:anti-sigma B factor antagonist